MEYEEDTYSSLADFADVRASTSPSALALQPASKSDVAAKSHAHFWHSH